MTPEQWAAMTPEQQAAYWAQWQQWEAYYKAQVRSLGMWYPLPQRASSFQRAYPACSGVYHLSDQRCKAAASFPKRHQHLLVSLRPCNEHCCRQQPSGADRRRQACTMVVAACAAEQNFRDCILTHSTAAYKLLLGNMIMAPAATLRSRHPLHTADWSCPAYEARRMFRPLRRPPPPPRPPMDSGAQRRSTGRRLLRRTRTEPRPLPRCHPFPAQCRDRMISAERLTHSPVFCPDTRMRQAADCTMF